MLVQATWEILDHRARKQKFPTPLAGSRILAQMQRYHAARSAARRSEVQMASAAEDGEAVLLCRTNHFSSFSLALLCCGSEAAVCLLTLQCFLLLHDVNVVTGGSTYELGKVESSRPQQLMSNICNFVTYFLPSQDVDSVHSVLLNFGVVAALMLSVVMSIVTTIPAEESVRGDILSLSLSSPHFRCHFAGASNKSTIDFCSPNFTTSNFGTNDAAVICGEDGATVLKTVQGKLWTKYMGLQPPPHPSGHRANTWKYWFWGSYYCLGDTRRLIKEFGCSATTFKEAYMMARDVSHEDFLEYVVSVSNASYNMGPFQQDLFRNCRPSQQIAVNGFRSILFLMLALFWSLYLLVNLTFSDSRNNPREMAIWWNSGGCVGTVLVLAFLLEGTFRGLIAMDNVIVIRFPNPFDQTKWILDMREDFEFYGIFAALIVIFSHFMLIRSWSFFKRLRRKPNEDSDAILTGYLVFFLTFEYEFFSIIVPALHISACHRTDFFGNSKHQSPTRFQQSPNSKMEDQTYPTLFQQGGVPVVDNASGIHAQQAYFTRATWHN